MVMMQVPQGILQVIALATKDYRRSQKLHHISHQDHVQCSKLSFVLFFDTFLENIVSGPEVVDNEVAPLSESEHPLPPLGSRQGSPTPTNDFVSHHSSTPTTFLSPPPPLVGTMQEGGKIQKHVTGNFNSLLSSLLLFFCTLQYNSQKLWTDM